MEGRSAAPCCGYRLVVLTLLLSSASLCAGQACQLVETVSGTNRPPTIYSGYHTECGHVPEDAEIPTAPWNLQFMDYPYPVRESKTLAVNITWKSPVNSTGLQGFIVEILKTSYPVGFQQCLGFTLSEPSTSMEYTLDCFHSLEVDEKYQVTVRSLSSGQSITRKYHTANCVTFPEVGTCLIDCKGCQGGIPPINEWRSPNRPSVEVWGDRVMVMFDIYPGDHWLDYKVNLHSYELHDTPDELSHRLNTNGSSGRFTDTFEGVKPGRYRADVKIIQGDAIRASSEDFSVVIPPTRAVVTEMRELTTSTDDSDLEDSNAFSREDLIKMGIGIGSTILAVILLAAMVIWKRQKRTGSLSQCGVGASASPFRGSMTQSEDTSDLVKNMQHNDLTAASEQCVQNNVNIHKDKWEEIYQTEGQGCGDSYLQGSIWTDMSDGPYVHTVDITNRSMLGDQFSLGGESGIPV